MSQRSFDRQAQKREQSDARRNTLRQRRRAGLAAGAVGAAVLLAPSAAQAANFTVANTNDSGTGSLRKAVSDAQNADEASTITFDPSLAGGKITLTSGQIEINGDNDLTIQGLGADPATGITIDGGGDSRIFSVSGGADTRISGVRLTGGNGIEGTNNQLRAAKTVGGAISRVSSFGDDGGGAITTDGQLTLSNSVVTDNSATTTSNDSVYAAGGGILVNGGETTVEGSQVTSNTVSADYASGGGIANTDGVLTVRSSSVTGNRAEAGFGQIIIVGGIRQATGLDVRGLSPSSGTSFGGGITAIGTTTVSENSHVDENSADYGAGIAGNDAAAKYDYWDRGRPERDLTVSDSTVSKNFGAFSGGGIGMQFGNFDSGPTKYGEIEAASTNSVTIVRSTLDGNQAYYAGGGLAVSGQQEDNPVTVRESTISNNVVEQPTPPARAGTQLSGRGGGISLAPGGGGGVRGPVTVSDSTVSGNSAEIAGGIDANAQIPSSSSGAPRAGDTDDRLRITTDTVGTDTDSTDTTGTDTDSTDTDSTTTDSTDTTGTDTDSTDTDSTDTTGTDTDSTTTDSTDTTGTDTTGTDTGGTTTDDNPPPPAPTGSVLITNSTVASNTASAYAGGLGVGRYATDGANIGVNSTIIAGNTANGAPSDTTTSTPPNTNATDDRSVRAADSGYTQIDSNYSLIQAPGTAAINADATRPTITGKDAQLGALQGNGGPTQTQLPAGSSPAIDQGFAYGLGIEQRGTGRTFNRFVPNAADGTDIGAVELPGQSVAQNPPPITPSSVPTTCGRRIISLVDARVSGNKVVLKGLVGSKYYGKKVTIQSDPKGAKASGFSRTLSVTASKKSGEFTAKVPKPSADDYITIRYRATVGSAKSPALKLPQSLTSRSVKSAKGTITIKGHVKKSLLISGKKVTVRRLACGRYRTMGSTKPDANGNYKLTFKTSSLRGIALYRAESTVLARPGAKKHVKQYARAIAIRTTGQTG